MKTVHALLFLSAAAAGTYAGCASTVPSELVGARQAYRRVSTGPAGQSLPAEVRKAHESLAAAEQAFNTDPDAYHTRDLAYVAQRKCERVEALASIASEQASRAKSNTDYTATQAQIIKETKGDLSDAQNDLSRSRSALGESERSGKKTADQLAAEKIARADAERRAASAQEALARLAAVKQEDRGMVITLSGSVLFASDQALLLPAAQDRLRQVADAMLTTGERTAVVEGHTDSRGSENHNMDLSQRRADAVRTFLVSRGYESDRITAHGIGKGRPVADNNSAEGRANNRRVEIIIEPQKRLTTN